MEHWQKGGPFLRVMHRFARVGTNPVPAHDLTKAGYFCLDAICDAGEEQPEKGGIYVWELARRTHSLPPAVSRTLRELEERGYIERSVDPDDRRNVKVRPTAEGLAICAKVAESTQVFINRVLERMGRESMDELVGLCDRLCDIIEDEQAKET